MPLQDSFSRRPSDQTTAHAPKPNRLPKPPTREDLEFTVSCAQNNPQVPLGLIWKKDEKIYLLTITAGLDENKNESAWVLHTGPDGDRSVVWSYRTSDSNMIFNLLKDLGTTTTVTWQALSEPPDGEISVDAVVSAGDLPVSAGSVFAEQYEILNELGVGGMGVVYKASDRKGNRVVAIKVLHGHLVSDPISKKRFEQEAKSAMTLAHPNLISTYHYGFSAGQPFLVMEYIDGYGLDELIGWMKQLDINTFLDIFIQSCDALTHAHEKGIIHRDLKPSNVMISNASGKMAVKIVDFGISKLLVKGDNVNNQSLTLAGDIVGSPLYMSPEQCKGEQLDVRSDVYSLGCLMYHAIVGSVPFEGENPLQTLGKHICDAPTPFSALRPDLVIPDKFEALIFKAMAKEPDDRFESIRQLRDELAVLSNQYMPKPVEPAQPVAQHTSACQLLVDVGDLPATTLDAAVKVQNMLRSGSLTLTEAARALGRAHLYGGQINVEEKPEEVRAPMGIETPVEAILVEAGLITNPVWRTLLALHQKIRLGKMTKGQALEEFRLQHPKPTVQEAAKVEPAVEKPSMERPTNVLELLKHAGLVTKTDLDQIGAQSDEDGTDLAKRLVAAGKLDTKTLLAARQCLSLMDADRLRLDRAVIALLYCHRSRVTFYQAVDELGWERP